MPMKTTWLGTLIISNIKLRIVFNISTNLDGILTATIDSPDQGVMGIPVDEITSESGNLHLEVKSIAGSFEGKIKEDDLIIEGRWKQAEQSFPLVVKRVDKMPQMLRPQEPKKPFPYKEEEIIYENKKAGIKLAGTLTLPLSEEPFSATLLITGSGQQDRNETAFSHRPFLVLADYLTRRGVAVLRADDRGVGGSTGNFFQATSEDFAGDVLAGVEYLKGRKEINPKKIGLIGHSEGGLIASIVAAQSADIAFIVMMAGQGLTGEELLYMQQYSILKTKGASDEVIAKNRNLWERLFAILKQEKDNELAEKKLCKIMAEELMKIGEQEKQVLGYSSKDRIKLGIKQLLLPWFRYYLAYNPRLTLMKVKIPVLAIIGEKDLQVPPKENLRAIEEALKDGGNKNYTLNELPNLNHLFQTAQTGLPSEYAKIEETISPMALKLIGDWVLQLAIER